MGTWLAVSTGTVLVNKLVIPLFTCTFMYWRPDVLVLSYTYLLVWVPPESIEAQFYFIVIYNKRGFPHTPP